MGVISCGSKEEFDSKMAEAKAAGKPAVIEFIATGCGPCSMIAPVFDKHAGSYPGAVFFKVDIDVLLDVANAYSLTTVPSFVFVKNGDKVDSITGAKPVDLQNAMVKHLGAPSSSA